MPNQRVAAWHVAARGASEQRRRLPLHGPQLVERKKEWWRPAGSLERLDCSRTCGRLRAPAQLCGAHVRKAFVQQPSLGAAQRLFCKPATLRGGVR